MATDPVFSRNLVIVDTSGLITITQNLPEWPTSMMGQVWLDILGSVDKSPWMQARQMVWLTTTV